MHTETVPKSYTCTRCGKAHQFPTSVFAHWEVAVDILCNGCGAIHRILRGVATYIRGGKQAA
jgi:hypothetical protein